MIGVEFDVCSADFLLLYLSLSVYLSLYFVREGRERIPSLFVYVRERKGKNKIKEGKIVWCMCCVCKLEFRVN